MLSSSKSHPYFTRLRITMYLFNIFWQKVFANIPINSNLKYAISLRTPPSANIQYSFETDDMIICKPIPIKLKFFIV